MKEIILERSKKQTLIESTPQQTDQMKESKMAKRVGFKNMESFVEWLCRNPYLAEKEYPEITQGLKNRLKGTQPHETALIIQKIPEQFNSWRNEINDLFGITKKKKIAQYIELLNLIIDSEYSTIIENEAAESVRGEITEQLHYWELEYSKINTTSAHVEESKIILTKIGEKFSLPQIALIYYYDKLSLNGNNCNDIVLKYGWNSGKKLLEWHTKFDTGTSHRLYAYSSGKKIYSILEYLTTEKGKTEAKKDLKDIGFDFE